MLFKTFHDWLFDGNQKNEIPKSDPENDVSDILEITHTYIISLFIKCGSFNNYLNKHFNNIGLRYVDKSELLYYIKEQVYKLGIKQHQLYYPARTRKNKLFDVLREKFLYLKNNDISLICDKIDKSDEKEQIYNSLEIKKSKRERIKKKKIKKDKVSLNDFLRNFTIMDFEKDH